MIKRVQSKLAQLRHYGRAASSLRSKPAFWVYGVARHNPFCSTNLVSRLGQLCFPELRLRPKSLGGRSVRVDTADLGHLLSFEEVLIDGTYDLGVLPFEPEIVLDCGAHIGLFSALILARFPGIDVTMFEPNRRNVKFLRRQIPELEGKVKLVEAAISVRSGTASFRAEYSNAGRIADDAQPGSDTVAVVDVQSVVPTLDGKRAVIKLDVEGEEERIVPVIAPSLPRQCVLFFETHRGEPAWNAVSDSLVAEGFTVRRTRLRGLYSDGYALRTG